MAAHPASNLLTATRTDRCLVFVATQNTLLRSRLVAVLSEDAGLSVACGDSADARHEPCELLVLHCDTVQSQEVATFSEMRAATPELRIVVVCDSADGRSTRRAMDGTVEGMVFTADIDAALLPTVAAVLAGQSVVPRGLRSSLQKAALSFREKQILGLVVMGFTNNEIAGRLFLAESTVKSHLSSAFSKLGVKSRSEAAAIILDPQGSLGASILSVTGAQAPANWAVPQPRP